MSKVQLPPRHVFLAQLQSVNRDFLSRQIPAPFAQVESVLQAVYFHSFESRVEISYQRVRF